MVGTGTRLILAEVAPRVTIDAIILADCTPLAFRQIRTPLLPRNFLFSRLLQPPLFRCLIQSLRAVTRLNVFMIDENILFF